MLYPSYRMFFSISIFSISSNNLSLFYFVCSNSSSNFLIKLNFSYLIYSIVSLRVFLSNKVYSFHDFNILFLSCKIEISFFNLQSWSLKILYSVLVFSSSKLNLSIFNNFSLSSNWAPWFNYLYTKLFSFLIFS